MKNVAVQGMTIVPVETGISIDGYVVVTSPSSNSFVDGKGIFSGDITVTVPEPTYGDYVAQSTDFTIHPTSGFADVDGNPCVLEGDVSDTLTLTGYSGSSSTTFALTLKVQKANQINVTAE